MLIPGHTRYCWEVGKLVIGIEVRSPIFPITIALICLIGWSKPEEKRFESARMLKHEQVHVQFDGRLSLTCLSLGVSPTKWIVWTVKVNQGPVLKIMMILAQAGKVG